MGKKFPLSSPYVIVLATIAIYLIIAALTVLTKRPWCDEAWFASPALNLLEEGHMGISVKELAGFRFTRMDQYTYWQPPLYYLAQAAWYSIFSFSLFSMRFLSVFWGIILLFSLLSVLNTLTNNRNIALLAAALTAVDFLFIGKAADGRMDMMSTALAFAGFAAYLSLRRKNLLFALLAGHALVAASGLTHPNGIMALMGIVFLNLYYDRDRIRVKHVLVALIPYALGLLGWGLYILQDPQAFLDQFGGNFTERFSGSLSLLTAFQMEITQRYLATYGFAEGASLMGKIRVLILIAYFMGLIGCAFSAELRKRTGVRALLILFLLYFLPMSMLIGNKSPNYLIYILPFYTSLLSVLAVRWWQESRTPKYLIVSSLALIFALQIGINIRHILNDNYRTDYLPTIERLRGLDYESSIVMGSAELAFELDLDRTLSMTPGWDTSPAKGPILSLLNPATWVGLKDGEKRSRKHTHISRTCLRSDMRRSMEMTSTRSTNGNPEQPAGESAFRVFFSSPAPLSTPPDLFMLALPHLEEGTVAAWLHGMSGFCLPRRSLIGAAHLSV